ncbi:mitochondrial 54S ribosomal protein uL22m [Limtongia smithiae]|uniref:mitochondrial 54S ribosomal protein uL22m n=1 Tax=Limtongia smithiae TaxID=1125753 RepID=UPI0034CEF074
MNAEAQRLRLEEEKKAAEKSHDEAETDRLNKMLDNYGGSVTESEGESATKIMKPEDDKELMEIMKPKPKTVMETYLSPLQRAVYLKQTTGEEDPLIYGKHYRFKPSRQLKQLLEPSVWVKSNTQKGSVKKVTPFLRSLRKMNIYKAIAHCHFSVKNIGRDVEKLLYRGIEEAKALGMDENSLYVDEIWSGKEPKPVMTLSTMLDYKGRGRAGLLKRKEHHVQVILKTEATLKRVAKEREQKMNARRPWTALRDKPFYYKSGSNYTW